MGIFLTFSGLGQGLSPDTWGNAGILIGTILLYSLFGMICAFFSTFLHSKWKAKTPTVQQTQANTVKTESDSSSALPDKE